MSGRHFSLSLLPTNDCNVACDDGFEDKTRDVMSLAQLSVFGPQTFTELLETSPARRRFHARPARLVRDDDCLACDDLSICQGGCPVRAYPIPGKFFVKDPYCAVYEAMFSRLEGHATRRHGRGAVA